MTLTFPVSCNESSIRELFQFWPLRREPWQLTVNSWLAKASAVRWAIQRHLAEVIPNAAPDLPTFSSALIVNNDKRQMWGRK